MYPRIEGSKRIQLSIVIPTYLSEYSIYNDLISINKVLEQTNYSYEIICIIDGTEDNSLNEAKRAANGLPHIRVAGYKVNKGKGYALRYGFAKARGDIIGFIDSGGEILPDSLLQLLKIMHKNDSDIVIGSKRHPESEIEYPLGRKITSLLYFFFVRTLFNIPVNDTQAGIKLFKKGVIKKLLPKLTVDRYAIDIEILVLAWLNGYRKINEAPIKVVKDKKSDRMKFSAFLVNIIRMFADTLAVYFKIIFTNYY